MDDNQELIALGSCSLIGSFFSAYPSTGSLSRSSLINNIGARTPVNTIISSLVILFTLYFLMDFIRFIPNCCLAAIVITNLFSLFKRLGDMKVLRLSSRGDFWTFFCCLIGVVGLGTQKGLLCGIAVSFIVLAVACLRTRKDSSGEIQQFEIPAGMEVVKSGKWLHFLSRYKLNQEVENCLVRDETSKCVLDLRSVCYIDASAMITIEQLWNSFNAKGQRLFILVEGEYIPTKLRLNGMEQIQTIQLSELTSL